MHICLIMDNPETPHHPVIAVAMRRLSITHTVRLLDVRGQTGPEVIAQEAQLPAADLYLLKSHAPQALETAHYLEQRGAKVVNSWSASVACQDRASMTKRMNEAHLPWPRTWHFTTLNEALKQQDMLATLPFPLIVKSSYSHRGDLVAKAHNLAELAVLCPQWSQEPIVLQEFAAGDGWDIKVWVIDQHIYAARRRTPLDPNAPKEDYPISASEMPADWLHIIREIGRVFELRLYGADLLLTAQGPIIVDVNSFPGFRGVPDADTALVTLVERLLQER
jgi:ribosomal protein S6--L-glutamate ligase